MKHLRLPLLLLVLCGLTFLAASPQYDLFCVAQKAAKLGDKAREDWTCLHYAASRGDADTVETMLAHGADIEVRNIDKRTPLHEAARRGELAVVKTLLRHGADPNAHDGSSGFTPLHLAAEQNHPAVVRRLIAEGANVDAKSRWNQTPLWQAAWQAWHENTEVAHILVANGAAVDVADEKGHTPLHMAARAGHTDMAEYLVSLGADLEHRNNKGRTPLYQATVGNNPQTVRLLLKAGADPNAEVNGWPPLRAALQRDYQSVADILHAHGARHYERYAADAHVESGKRLLEGDKTGEAIQAFDAALAVRPEDTRARYYRGLALADQGDTSQATADLRQVLEMDPAHAEATERLGSLYVELGEYERAIDYLERLIELRPEDARAYHLLARSRRGLGREQAAQAAAEQACTLGYAPACDAQGASQAR